MVSPFQTGNPPLRNEQWGASAGGPFWKDHTFWFANFEKQKFRIATGNQGTEPSAAYQAQALDIAAAVRCRRQLRHQRAAQNALARRRAHRSRAKQQLPRFGSGDRLQLQRRDQARSQLQRSANRCPRAPFSARAIRPLLSAAPACSRITSKSRPSTSTTTRSCITGRSRRA